MSSNVIFRAPYVLCYKLSYKLTSPYFSSFTILSDEIGIRVRICANSD